MICKTCNEYYRISEYNNSIECENCVDQLLKVLPEVDTEDQAEINLLVNPSGCTRAVFYD